MTSRIIGLAGHAGHGKTTVAKHLQAAYGYNRRHPLQAMKDAFKLWGLSEDEINGSRKETPCDLLGGTTPRQAQIDVGNLGRRWWRGFWITQDLRANAGLKHVNESVRFPDEADAIDHLGGLVIGIVDPRKPIPTRWGAFGKILYGIGLKSLALDATERVHLIDVHIWVVNDGTIEELHSKIDDIMGGKE